MKPLITVVRRMVLIASLGWIAHWAAPASAQTNEAICIVELRGKVEILPHGATNWVLTQTSQSLYPLDRVRTRANSSVGLLLSDQSVLRFGAMSEMEIPPNTGAADQGLHLLQGILSFFHRDKPGRIHVIASGGLAGIEGTEFVMAVGTTNGVEQTTLSVIDGKVRFSNDGVTLVLTNGEQAVGEPGQAPCRTPGFIAKNILQWCFYYPGVLDLNELPLTAGEQAMLGESLTAYRAGDLLAALAKYPDPRQPGSDAERVYHAALLLSVGQVEQAEANLSALTATGLAEKNRRLATALRTLIAAMKREPRPSTINYQLSTELLAASYYEQSLTGPKSLNNALAYAQRAVTNSPDFGFGWERVAELEFSFGRTDRALADLKQALRLSPRNAQALALKGFLLAARNQTREAIEQFDRALAVDSALGNAWLGRGLCRIRRGDTKAGREDLLVAAAMEPQRAALRSYLGKALGDAGDTRRAIHELTLAKQLDTNDPTAWLYSALLNEQNNRINEAVRDLETSQSLNHNRSVYRSGLLLDQDRAVRSANLARIYDEAGMPDVAFREAVRAVNSDYENYSAHLFLANSYDQLRDPNLVNLRFEPAETTEYLLANLLAPVGAGTLSPAISQQEYSKLFEQDGLHLFSSAEYLSRGAWNLSAAQYGTFGDTSYSLEAGYRSDPGQQVNNGIEEHTETISVKQQLTPHDSLFTQVGWFSTEGGDLAQRYDPNKANPYFQSQESQDASLILGYHHEWQPGVDTLVLAARVPDRAAFSDPISQTLVFDPIVHLAVPISLMEQYQASLTMYLVEVQQLVRHNDRHDTIAGIRFACGSLKVDNTETVPAGSILPGNGFPDPGQPVSLENFSPSIERLGAYLYHRWELVDGLWLQGGISYDWVRLPENFLYAPLSNQEITRDQVSPKAGIVWTPLKDTTVRFAYTRSLTGASFEQSLGLEPSQIAGFTQTYRDVVPETAVGGPTPATPFDTYGAALEQKFGAGTYLGISCQLINSTFDRAIGGYYLDLSPATFTYSVRGPASARQHLDYTEKSLMFTANQLAGRDFSFGVKYQLTRAELAQQLTAVEDPFLPLANGPTTVNGVLHQVYLNATWNHPSGLFAQFNALWSLQRNRGYSPAEPGDNFWQLNFLAGYRFPRRQAQISIGILNLTDCDYRLEPLTFYNELPRSRTIAAQFTFNF
jgi:tetratricopeptide (TPR) repeat protein